MRKRWIVRIVFFVFVISIIKIIMFRNEKTIPRVQLKALYKKKKEKPLEVVGTIKSKEIVYIYKKQPMVIKRIFIKEGQKVKKGDVLVSFYDVWKNKYLDNGTGELYKKWNTAVLDIGVTEKRLSTLQKKRKTVAFQLAKATKIYDDINFLFKEGGTSSLEVGKYAARKEELTIKLEDVDKEILINKKLITTKKVSLEVLREELKNIIIAKEDGVITAINVKKGMQVDIKVPILIIASIDKGVEVEVEIPFEKEVNLGEKSEIKLLQRDINTTVNGSVEHIGKFVEKNGKKLLYKSGIIEVEKGFNCYCRGIRKRKNRIRL